MILSMKHSVRRGAAIGLVGALALGIAACEKSPPPQTAAKPVIKPAEAPAPRAAAPAAAQPPAPAAPQPAPPSPDQLLASKVKAALGGVKGLDTAGLDVQASEGVVKLYGTVGNLAQRNEASKVAMAVPGVRSVENHLAVVSGS